MNAITSLGSSVGTRGACAALNVYRSRYYRFQRPKLARRRAPPPLKLNDAERQHIHELLVSPSFVDQAPATVVANLLDDAQYLCSERTLYRILHEHHQVRERRRGHRRVHRKAGVGRQGAKPVLVVGHRQTQGATHLAVLLPLRHHRPLQPLRRGLGGGRA